MLLDCLIRGEQDVSTLVDKLGWPQADVSKHLSVLRSVDLVVVRPVGRRRVYGINGAGLKPIHDWTSTYEKFWTNHLDRIKARAEAVAAKSKGKTK